MYITQNSSSGNPLTLLALFAFIITVLLLANVILDAIRTFSDDDDDCCSGNTTGEIVVQVNQTGEIVVQLNQTENQNCLGDVIITSNNSASIQPSVRFRRNGCNDFSILDWRLHRVCGTVTFGLHARCPNVSDTRQDFDFDINMSSFPVGVNIPSPNLERWDVSGTGSFLASTPFVSGVVEIDGDESNTQAIDFDIRTNADIQSGDSLELSMLCIYKAFP